MVDNTALLDARVLDVSCLREPIVLYAHQPPDMSSQNAPHPNTPLPSSIHTCTAHTLQAHVHTHAHPHPSHTFLSTPDLTIRRSGQHHLCQLHCCSGVVAWFVLISSSTIFIRSTPCHLSTSSVIVTHLCLHLVRLLVSTCAPFHTYTGEQDPSAESGRQE